MKFQATIQIICLVLFIQGSYSWPKNTRPQFRLEPVDKPDAEEQEPTYPSSSSSSIRIGSQNKQKSNSPIRGIRPKKGYENKEEDNFYSDLMQCPKKFQPDSCIKECKDNENCAGNKICCYHGCGTACYAPIKATVPAYPEGPKASNHYEVEDQEETIKITLECPVLKPELNNQTCENKRYLCYQDSDCSPSQKCCELNCGTRCVGLETKSQVKKIDMRKERYHSEEDNEDQDEAYDSHEAYSEDETEEMYTEFQEKRYKDHGKQTPYNKASNQKGVQYPKGTNQKGYIKKQSKYNDYDNEPMFPSYGNMFSPSPFHMNPMGGFMNQMGGHMSPMNPMSGMGPMGQMGAMSARGQLGQMTPGYQVPQIFPRFKLNSAKYANGY